MIQQVKHGLNQLFADKLLNNHSDMMYAGVISGNNNGTVWVDDVSNPTFCIAWSEFLEGFHFMGSGCSHMNNVDINTFVDNTATPFLRAKNKNTFEFSCDSREWIPSICEMFKQRKVDSSKQYVYKLAHTDNLHRNMANPKGYEILEINENSINEILVDMENYEELQSDIKKAWGSVPIFLEMGKGFVAIQKKIICSFASTHFLYKNTHSIGTKTFDTYKRNGLSSFLSMTLIDRLVNNGSEIWWDCMDSNIASQKTAEKVGLTFSHEYEIFWFDL